MSICLRRREFIAALGGAAAWPLAAGAQQQAMQPVAFINSGSAGGFQHLVVAFRQGLKETGYVEGQNVAVEYRCAEGHYDRVPVLAEHPNGCTGAVLLAHGFSLELLNEFIGAGLATASAESMTRGSKPVEVLRVKITEAGRFPALSGTMKALRLPSRVIKRRCRAKRASGLP
jgi:hypothetical protein